jgi:NhaP-type Na+/H+ or K+/H+ antiporter
MEYLLNALYGALGGLARGILAYLKVAEVEKFDPFKLLQTLIIAAVFGVLSSIYGAGPSGAIATGILGDQFVNLIMQKRRK